MGWKHVATAVTLAGLLIGNSAATAQDPEDWDFGADPERDLAIAAVTFDNFGVAVRCMNDNLSVVVSGLPVASGERRLSYSMGGDTERESVWISGRNSTSAFAIWPRYVATGLSRGGRLVIVAPDGEQSRRYAVDLPPSSSAVGRVFQACGKVIEPAGENTAPSGESFAGVRWAEEPEASFPSQANMEESGIGAVSCTLRANGRMRACQIESEFPEGSGFGRAAQFGANRTARAEPLDPSGPSMEGIRVAFMVRFIAYGAALPPSASRLPAEEERRYPGLTRTPRP
jgi:hypothetical protein